MFDEMRAAGSRLPYIVEALQKEGWKNRNHHDNWYHPSKPDEEFDTHGAYAQHWWRSLPMQDIIECKNGWANLVMKYYPEKTDCKDVTSGEIIYMYRQEHKQ